MAPEERHAQACLTKRQYPSVEDAESAAAWAAGKRNIMLGVYQCPACQRWHLTKRVDWRTWTVRCGTCMAPFDPPDRRQWQCDECIAKEKQATQGRR